MSNIKNSNISNLNIFCFLTTILFLSNLSLSLSIRISKTKLKSISISISSTVPMRFELSGNLWEKIADEVSDNAFYTFPEQDKEYLVAYGFGDKWIVKEFKNLFSCNNEDFAENPYSEKAKSCFSLNNFKGFKDCAEEGETCLMNESGFKLVRFGDKNSYKWTYNLVDAGFIGCFGSEFGAVIAVKDEAEEAAKEEGDVKAVEKEEDVKAIVNSCSYVVTGA